MLCQPDTPHRATIARTGGKHADILWPRSKPWPNKVVEPTPNSFRSYVAPAIGRGSPRAFLRHEVASFTARDGKRSCDLAWCGATCSRTVGASLATARYQARGKAQHCEWHMVGPSGNSRYGEGN